MEPESKDLLYLSSIVLYCYEFWVSRPWSKNHQCTGFCLGPVSVTCISRSQERSLCFPLFPFPPIHCNVHDNSLMSHPPLAWAALLQDAPSLDPIDVLLSLTPKSRNYFSLTLIFQYVSKYHIFPSRERLIQTLHLNHLE